MLVAAFKSEGKPLAVRLQNLPWGGEVRVETYRVDERHDLERTGEQTLPVVDAVARPEVPANGGVLLRLTRP